RARAALPDSLGAALELARSLGRSRRFDEGARVIEQSLQRGPGETRAWFELGKLREEQGDVPAAEAAMRKVIEAEPRNGVALNFLGYLFAEHNQNLEEAVHLTQRALTAEPDNPFYIDSLGWAYYQLGRLEDARRELERAVQLGANEAVVYEHLGDVYAG